MTILALVLIVFCVGLIPVECSDECTKDKRPTISVKGNNPYYPNTRTTLLSPGGLMELFCTSQSNRLKMTRSLSSYPLQNLWIALPTQIVNETTVRFAEENIGTQALFYACSDMETDCNKVMFLVVDTRADLSDFNCISNNLDDFNCFWSSTNAIARFSLFVLGDDKTFRTACDFSELDFERKMFCTWPNQNSFVVQNILHLLIKACNPFGCIKKSFEFHYLSIVKLDPPRNIEILHLSSHSVVLEWKRSYSKRLIYQIEVEHRVEYWFSGIQPREVNASSVRVVLDTYRLELRLPCPNQYYEVKISMRPIKALGEEYWSDFKALSFVTKEEIEKGSTVVDPVCVKQPIVLTPEIMNYEIYKLKEKIEEEQSKVKTRIRALKARAALINVRLAA